MGSSLLRRRRGLEYRRNTGTWLEQNSCGKDTGERSRKLKVLWICMKDGKGRAAARHLPRTGGEEVDAEGEVHKVHSIT